MSIKVALEHRTTYEFARPVAVGPHVVRLRPAPHSRTPIEAYSLEVTPKGHFVNWQQDPFGNWMARLVFPEKTDRLEITVGLVADMMVINPFDFFIEEYAERFPFDYEPELAADLAPYLRPVESSEAADAWRRRLPALPEDGVPTVQFLAGLNAAVHDDVAYSVRMEAGVQTPDETLALAIGSCRDSAWLLVSLLRQYGLAARFVSGYLVQLTADQEALDGPSGPTEDFTDLHAWCEVYIPGAGWIGLDPTSALFAGEGHIPLSATPHPSSAAPITGATEPVEVTFSFSNHVRRIHEDPRVTKPYTDDAWGRIDALGAAVDERLRDDDVRLTMGGEPTFVALDPVLNEDGASPEWNTEADGEQKRVLAADLAARLMPVFAIGGAVHRGQGKWYPGEPLPRWNIALQWRTDGVPLWREPALFGDPWAGGETTDATRKAAAEVAGRLVDALGVEGLLPAYDIVRAEPAGWVLPLAFVKRWVVPAWTLPGERLVLIPGSSAVGLRLPLDQIEMDEDYPTSALAVEARDGLVHVFVPPLDGVDEYAELLAAIEDAVAAVGCQVVLEGYCPPPDARFAQLVVTPDPGVIEVNVQPTRDWASQRDLVTTLYEVARQARLSTEKFDLDGLHTGTGGGNHLTLGGATPADSPLLRRPDLLASLVTYWQRHPALSYLFSGRFVGPTSQAPRFDEGRPEAVYEMEIALAELRRVAGRPRPWHVDRLLRHLLTDLTGNTHRAEFCVDKLYSPDSSRGRLGLLELRGFEMPPHGQMALVQALLVRSLVALLWDRPCADPLIRWGTELHEDFLLPHGCVADIELVVADLNAAGIPFELSWLDPFVEFRFPRIGVTRVGDIDLELRQAVEPWHVLGEEATSGGTARYVDSSVERIQVLVRGLDPDRHLVTCQGVPVPLTPTGTLGEFYAGVRYKAWSPWSSLHPTIDVHAPLHFDVVDIASEVSLGGATYHVVHPGGRSYEHPPINANEAEARRASRFESRGHTAGRLDVAAMQEAGRRAASREYPHILDLRRVTIR